MLLQSPPLYSLLTCVGEVCPLNVVAYAGEKLKLSNSRWTHTAVTVLSTYNTCSCVPPQGENS